MTKRRVARAGTIILVAFLAVLSGCAMFKNKEVKGVGGASPPAGSGIAR